MMNQASGAYAITIEAHIRTAAIREADQPSYRLSQGSVTAMYWTAAQLVAHHTSNGCNLHPGDLFGTGTLSGETETSFGSLLEISRGRSEEHTSELQSLMSISYAVFCLKKKKNEP